MSAENNTLSGKIDFAIVMAVENANPNGDPLNGNRPRQTYDGYGEISDVCLKRKLRNRLLDMGECIFVQSDDKRNDEFRSLHARFNGADFSIKDENLREKVCKKWYDVRAFGQVFAFKEKDKKNKSSKKSKNNNQQLFDIEENAPAEKEEDSNGESQNNKGVSIGIRGPVSIQSAYSLDTVTTSSMQITKSVNLETNESDPNKKTSDTMGMKHRVIKGVYVAYGAISPQLASITGFSDDDAEKLKMALRSIFENDLSSARPAGSMEVLQVVWWHHNSRCGQYSSAAVHRALKKHIKEDGTINEDEVRAETEGLNPEFLEPLQGNELNLAENAQN